MAEKLIRETQVDLSRINQEIEDTNTRLDQEVSDINTRIDGLGKVFNYKGRVDSIEDLPSTGNDEGDLYLVGLSTDPDKAEYFWTGNAWEYLGNTSNQNYATETAPGISQVATTAEVTNGTNNTKYVTPSKLKTFVDNKISTKADLVNGIVPENQLPEQATNAAKNDLSNVTSIASTSKVQTELNGKVSKAGDTMTGRLSMGANDILFQNPDGGSLLQIATDGSNWDLRGDATWLRFSPDQFGLTLRDVLGTQDFYSVLHTKNFAPDYANKINFAANGEENTAVKAGYVFVAMNTNASGNPRKCRTVIKRNGVEVFGLTLGNDTNLQSIYSQFFPVIKGDVYSVTCYNTGAITCYFIPLLGA